MYSSLTTVATLALAATSALRAVSAGPVDISKGNDVARRQTVEVKLDGNSLMAQQLDAAVPQALKMVMPANVVFAAKHRHKHKHHKHVNCKNGTAKAAAPAVAAPGILTLLSLAGLS